jgi:hypothetical protein
MTHLPEIWKCIKGNMPRRVWVDIEDIYKLIKDNISLDDEDFLSFDEGFVNLDAEMTAGLFDVSEDFVAGF